MTSSNYAISYQARFVAGTSGLLVGDVVFYDAVNDGFDLATPASLAAGARAAGVVAQLGQGGFVLHSSGPIAPAITGLGPGTASPVRVSALGRLERVASPTESDDYAGMCDASGLLHAAFGSTYPMGGEKGPKGDTGDTGPRGELGGVPDESGIVTLDPATRAIRGPFTWEYANRVDVAGTALTILEFVLPTNLSGKLVIECKAESANLSKVQTLDTAYRWKLVAGAPTIVLSGAPLADDADALGAVFTIETYFAFVHTFRVRASGFTGRASAAVRVLL